ncbi:MAG: helix-turn-helix domain-containing protein [Planctomycetes bacterium]|nr:helix-turn-helix domain-containing protein [Planctomycetota bacterium]
MPVNDSQAALVATDLSAMGMQPLVRVPDLCKLLQLSRESLYRAIKIGELPAMRCGGPKSHFMIRRDDVAAWLSRHRTA